MVRLSAVALGVLGLFWAARSQPPAPKAEPLPPYKRLLDFEDATKAEELEQTAFRNLSGDYLKAVAAIEELLALRTRVQGADHWQTVSARLHLATLKKIAALPPAKRAAWTAAFPTARTMTTLESRDRHAETLSFREANLARAQQDLGDEDQYTISALQRLAFVLEALGRDKEAEPHRRKGLELRIKVFGESHPETGRAYSNLAGNLADLGRHADAEPLLRKTLEIYQKAHGENHAMTAFAYSSLSLNLTIRGKSEEAAALMKKASAFRPRAQPQRPGEAAVALETRADGLTDRGLYAQAEPLLRGALDIRRKALGENHVETADTYGLLADTFAKRELHAQAEPLLRKAHTIYQTVRGESDTETASALAAVAFNLDNQMRHADAEPLHRDVLALARKYQGGHHPTTAMCLAALATNLRYQGRHADATPLLEQALEIRMKSHGERHPQTADAYQDVARNLEARGQIAAAIPLHEKARDIYREVFGEYDYRATWAAAEIAQALVASGKDAEARVQLNTAVRGHEVARLRFGAGGVGNAGHGTHGSPYRDLALLTARLGAAADAWEAAESDLARHLLDTAAVRRGPTLTAAETATRKRLVDRLAVVNRSVLPLVTARTLTPAEEKELAALRTERAELDRELADLAVTVSRRELTPLAAVQKALPPGAALVLWVDTGRDDLVREHWGCVVRADGAPAWERSAGSGARGEWTAADDDLPHRYRQALLGAGNTDALAKALAAQRLAPLEKHLAGVTQLVVIPVNQMAGMPVETLTARRVSYTPSGSFLAKLKGRPKPAGAATLLAIGDPLFPPRPDDRPRPAVLPPAGLLIRQIVPDGPAAKARLQVGDVLVAYAGEELKSLDRLDALIAAKAKEKAVAVRVWRESEPAVAEREVEPGRLGAVFAREPAREAVAARQQADALLARAARGEAWAELPGTQVEVARLAGLFDPKNVTALTRADATEARLDALRTSGALARFRYLHFATHGKANDWRAFESALILTPPAKEPDGRAVTPYLDGRLTADEVLELWRLNAELVTLSACESGLGKRGGGDGLLGFAQAFLSAGCRSVCLTLWQVDDTATALLMDRFYQNLTGRREPGAKPMGKADALHEAKAWLRNLTVKEAEERLGALTDGVVRGERPAREVVNPVPKANDKGARPYAHPRYWAAFVLVGDPD